ncbi:hypothetical protein [Aquimarina sp. 2201CG14-23]|uniref:hypothetical protein n=1 Tax=Aquimarina mycalae TaxID=3040073 RepID=UPI002477FDE7|nr:hypothetical protein [Aquimarina sp. 2201CG14-23]MDH7446836.1 hypothetical protein [Aquimarina sp. 2201CG14-23]
MTKYYDLGFAKVEVQENYIKNTIEEGFLVMPKHNNLLIEFVTKYFSDIPFVYISNRVNVYYVDPMVYYEARKINNLMGIAVVSKNPRQKKLTELESKFFTKELEYFANIRDALEWKNRILKN